MEFTKKIAGWVAGRIKGKQARRDTMRWMEKTGLGQILGIAGDIALTQGALKGVSGLKGLMTGQKAAAAGAPLKALPAPGAATTTVAPRAATAVGAPAAAAPMAAPVAAPAAVTQAPMRAMVAPGAPVGPVTPKIGMPQMPTSLPPAGGAAPTPIASQVSAGMRPPTPPTPAPTFAAAPRPALPPAPSPMQAMVAPPAAAPAPVGGMTPQMTRTAGQMGGMQNVTNANVVRSGGFRGFMQGAKEYAPLIQATAMPVANVIGAKIEQDIEEEKIKREQEARNRLAMLLMPMFQAQMGQAAPSFQPRG